MQGYDDITGFRKATGVSNYKILSKYNSDNILKKWNVLERIHGAAVADSIYPQMPGLTEFQDVPPWKTGAAEETAQPQTVFDIKPLARVETPPARVENKPIITESPHSQRFPQHIITHVAETTMTMEPVSGNKFSTIFNQKTPQPDAVPPSNQQRDIQLKMLFERISSCQ